MTENYIDGRIEKFVKGVVKNQTMNILIGKQRGYKLINAIVPARKIFCKYDEISFDCAIKFYFSKARSVYSSKFSRIKQNKNIKELKQKYPMVNVVKMAQLLSMEEKFTANKKSDIKMLERLIRCSLSLPMYEIEDSLENVDSDISIIEYLKEQDGHEDILKMIEENKIKYQNKTK